MKYKLIYFTIDGAFKNVINVSYIHTVNLLLNDFGLAGIWSEQGDVLSDTFF